MIFKVSNYESKKYETLWKLRDGITVLLRHIKPDDKLLWFEMFQIFLEDLVRDGFFYMTKGRSTHELELDIVILIVIKK